MKKIIGICLFFCVLVIGCSNPIKDDLLTYINVELPTMVDAETNINTAYSSVSGENYTDDYTMYDVILTQVIPESSKLITQLETITIKLNTEELRNLNEKYVKAMNDQHQAFVLTLNALKTKDYTAIATANEYLTNSRKLVREWLVEIQTLCNENGVELPQ